jgi:putative membrane protein
MFHGWLIWPLLFWGPFHGLLSLLAVILVFSLIFRHRRYYYYGHPWWGRGRSDALDVLESRYARGEIQRDEYLQKKHDLGG